MAFAIGDKVVHPKIGAGTVTGTGDRELIGGFKSYYVIEIPAWDSTVYVPAQTADELGLRPVSTPEVIANVLDMLADRPHRLPGDAKERQEQVEVKLGTGRPLLVAEVLRDLAWHKSAARLNQRDEMLMARGRKLLASEIAVVLEIGVEEAYGVMDGAVQVALAQGVPAEG